LDATVTQLLTLSQCPVTLLVKVGITTVTQTLVIVSGVPNTILLRVTSTLLPQLLTLAMVMETTGGNATEEDAKQTLSTLMEMDTAPKIDARSTPAELLRSLTAPVPMEMVT
jgi:hypothetical protein